MSSHARYWAFEARSPTREQLDRAQARAEERIDPYTERDALVEVMCMLAQPPRDNEYSGGDRRAV